MSNIRWPLVIVISGSAAVLGMMGVIGMPLRPVVAFWFLLVCPGMAFVRLLRLKNLAGEWTLALGLSLTLGVIVSEALVLAHQWSPERALYMLVAVSLVGAALQEIQNRRWSQVSGRRG